jgi:outer membrane protein OmpU
LGTTFDTRGKTMKKVLLATTALVLSAGVASAEVSVSGNARVGLTYNEANAQSTLMNSRVRIAFSASGETDSGLSYSASARIRTGNEGDASVNAFNELGVTISGAFGSLTVGSESSAAEYAVGDLAGVGYAGAGSGNETAFLTGARALYSITTGGLTVYASAGQLGSDEFSAAVAYSAGAMSAGVGYEDNGAQTATSASVGYAMGDTKVKAVYMDSDAAGEQMGASVAHAMGAVSMSAYYLTTDAVGAGADDNNYGLGVGYDLGGGAKLAAGVASIDGNNRADLGINLSF